MIENIAVIISAVLVLIVSYFVINWVVDLSYYLVGSAFSGDHFGTMYGTTLLLTVIGLTLLGIQTILN